MEISGVSGEEAQVSSLKAQEAYAEHLKTVFTTEDLTETYQTEFGGQKYLSTSFPSFYVLTGASLSVKTVDAGIHAESNRTYNYTAERVITKNGEEIPFIQTGKVQFSEDGQILWIDTYTFNDLTMKIGE